MKLYEVIGDLVSRWEAGTVSEQELYNELVVIGRRLFPYRKPTWRDVPGDGGRVVRPIWPDHAGDDFASTVWERMFRLGCRSLLRAVKLSKIDVIRSLRKWKPVPLDRLTREPATTDGVASLTLRDGRTITMIGDRLIREGPGQ